MTSCNWMENELKQNLANNKLTDNHKDPSLADCRGKMDSLNYMCSTYSMCPENPYKRQNKEVKVLWIIWL